VSHRVIESLFQLHDYRVLFLQVSGAFQYSSGACGYSLGHRRDKVAQLARGGTGEN
jgi:hypothetical protein